MIGASLVGYTAYVYDINDVLLVKTKIAEHDRKEMQVELSERPRLKHGDKCKVLVLSFPVPQEYMGTALVSRLGPVTILLYRGRDKESRGSTRYKVDVSVGVENLIRGGQSQNREAPHVVKLINISSGGARFLAPSEAFSIGDKLEILLRIGSKDERVWLEVVNALSVSRENAEFGCKMISAGSPAKGG
jgi:hypothetical protein